MTFRFTLMAVATLLLLTSCFGRKKTSSVTGWNLNDPKWGGYELSDRVELPTAPGLVFIEGGSFVMGHVSEDTRYKWDNTPHTVTVTVTVYTVASTVMPFPSVLVSFTS